MTKQEGEIIQLPAPDTIEDLTVDKILTSRYQMRIGAYEKEEDLQQLAHSIKTIGLSHLPWVRPHPMKDGFYEIISGHRRIDAVKRFLKWKSVRCQVFKNLSEQMVLFLVGEENLARRNIYPYEKGLYFRQWREKFEVEDIAEMFSYSPDAILSWLDLQQNVDKITQSLTEQEKQQFISKATRQKIELLLNLKSERDIVEACRKTIKGDELPEIQRFVEASINASQKVSGISKTTAKEEAPPEKRLLSTYSKLAKSRNYEEAMENTKALGQVLQSTLDEFQELKATFNGIKTKDKLVIKVKKAGPINVSHRKDNSGTVYCVHEVKDSKPIITRVKF